MGLISAALGAASGVLADSWKEYFYCEAMPADVLVAKGHKRASGRSSNTKGSDNIITSGSVVAVADGQCMIIVDQGKVVELCAEPGEFVYDASTEASIFSGSLGAGIEATFAAIGKRLSFGGEAPKDQRVYYFNTKEITGNKYGTASPVPFRVVDKRAGIDIDIALRCFGEYSYRIADPMLFYTNVCGNISDYYKRDKIDGMLKSEMLTALQPAFAKISDMGIRYSAVPGHTMELADALNEVLSAKWRDLRGIEVVSIGVNSIKASEEDEALIKELQKEAAKIDLEISKDEKLTDANLAAAHLIAAQAQAMQNAASNTGSGAMMGLAGVNMAANMGGVNVADLLAAGQAQKQNASQGQKGWTCSCGAVNTGNFCTECGKTKPAQINSWTCKCGAVNKGKFCAECGSPKPAGVPQYKCDKCGWEPEDPSNPPKFCPECGDPFDDGDIV